MMTLSIVLLSFSLQAAELENPLRVEMIADVKTIVSGQTFNVGFLLHHPPEHHSYWKHPGIVGVATAVKWELPDGFVAGEILWPAPDQVMMSRYPAQGYRNETLLIIPVTAPAELPKNSYELKAKLTWMCCGKTCHPGLDVPFSHTLAVGKLTLMDEKTLPLFTKYRALVPVVDNAWETECFIEKEKILLTIKPTASNRRTVKELGEIRFFTADGTVDSAKPQRAVFQEPGTMVLEMQRSEFAPASIDCLSGVLFSAQGWSDGRHHIEIRAPLHK